MAYVRWMHETDNQLFLTGTLAPLISVVFVTYERMQTLVPTLYSFIENTDYPRDRLQLIVTDDGSSATVRDQIRDLPFDRHVFAPRRTGLGANMNRGLRAADHDLVLQLEDDWQCEGPPNYLRRAVRALTSEPYLGLVNLNTHPKTPPLKRQVRLGNTTLRVYSNEPEVKIRKVGQHAYTNWPHLKERAFIERIGPYREAIPMWETELDYARRINAQTDFFIGELADVNAFRHIGADLSFNKGSYRARVSAKIRAMPYGDRLVEGAKKMFGILR